MRLLRSYLFAPGNNETLLRKVFAAGADAVVLDLEDAVPESEKARARACVTTALASEAANAHSGSGDGPATFVRINSLDSGHWRTDVDAVAGPRLAGLRIPKAEDLDSLCRLNDALSDRERALGLEPGSIRVVATIETARGLARVASIARAPRLSGFTFGAADFCADVAADPSDDAATLFARSALVMASRDRRLAPPIASVFTSLTDGEGLRADTERQKRLGFFGRSAIHPRQVPIIHAIFEPTAEEVAAAQAVVAAYAAAGREGRGVTQTGGGFVDRAIVRRAQATITLHELPRRDRP
jgi:citrate lyase subunit beta/citryl-CoA lyase